MLLFFVSGNGNYVWDVCTKLSGFLAGFELISRQCVCCADAASVRVSVQLFFKAALKELAPWCSQAILCLRLGPA